MSSRREPGLQATDPSSPDDQSQSPLFVRLPLDIRRQIYLQLWLDSGLTQHIYTFNEQTYLRSYPCICDPSEWDEDPRPGPEESSPQVPPGVQLAADDLQPEPQDDPGDINGTIMDISPGPDVPRDGNNQRDTPWCQHKICFDHWIEKWDRSFARAYSANYRGTFYLSGGNLKSLCRRSDKRLRKSPLLLPLLVCRRMYQEAGESMFSNLRFSFSMPFVLDRFLEDVPSMFTRRIQFLDVPNENAPAYEPPIQNHPNNEGTGRANTIRIGSLKYCFNRLASTTIAWIVGVIFVLIIAAIIVLGALFAVPFNTDRNANMVTTTPTPTLSNTAYWYISSKFDDSGFETIELGGSPTTVSVSGTSTSSSSNHYIVYHIFYHIIYHISYYKLQFKHISYIYLDANRYKIDYYQRFSDRKRPWHGHFPHRTFINIYFVSKFVIHINHQHVQYYNYCGFTKAMAAITDHDTLNGLDVDLATANDTIFVCEGGWKIKVQSYCSAGVTSLSSHVTCASEASTNANQLMPSRSPLTYSTLTTSTTSSTPLCMSSPLSLPYSCEERADTLKDDCGGGFLASGTESTEELVEWCCGYVHGPVNTLTDWAQITSSYSSPPVPSPDTISKHCATPGAQPAYSWVSSACLCYNFLASINSPRTTAAE
ncbi:hypothetical protein VP1G_02404 [Cytospora mali]|uniref:Uncharacterized protein n=1 Tax=Cytospora mali TaxID=578113 RepID=A0A194UTF8_CYTMA|nr:hypothetical protein VP1G_02404 [Valsa mali var. pyri (nom. inval.)]